MTADKADDEVSVNLSEADLNAPINRIADGSVNIVQHVGIDIVEHG